MISAITAIGTAVPIHRQNQRQAAQVVTHALNLKPAERRLLNSVYQSTGIEYRHSVLSDFCKSPGEYTFFPNDPALPFPSTAARMQIYKENALNLSLLAIQNCFATLTDFHPQAITHLITVSCTGMYAPGIDIELVMALKLNSNVQRTAIQFMGCYGAFNAIKVADAICKADTAAKVLVVCVELCTIHLQKNDAIDSIIANAIFSDGAAAVLIEADPKRSKYLSLDAFHCDLLPQHNETMTWHIADSGFDIVLSSYVPQAIRSGIAAFTERLLSQQNRTLTDVDLYAIHPGGKKILQACEEVLSINEDDNRYSYEVLRQYGNMSSATVLFVLKAIWDDRIRAQANKQIFSCAFGPGLTLEAMLLSLVCDS